ncbi:DNA repair protein [Ascobolus immersus RN42]|uniref:DNA repair protein REV1 n=1 Tax=Ascobolus immersus RN42 TaxID=1160509 RepID=A0A3N4HZQ0_ASCIM|nr:DNA repair protein [Ascobolus immersus RN42]
MPIAQPSWDRRSVKDPLETPARSGSSNSYDELLEELDNEGVPFSSSPENQIPSSIAKQSSRSSTPNRTPNRNSAITEQSPRKSRPEDEFNAEGLSQLSQRSLNLGDLPKDFWDDYNSPAEQDHPQTTPKLVAAAHLQPAPKTSLKRRTPEPASSPVRPPNKRKRTESSPVVDRSEVPDSEDDEGFDQAPELGLSSSQKVEQEALRYLADPNVRNQTCLNPNFLTNFFQNSRLHHLSTWKAELKNRFQEMASSQTKRTNRRLPRRYILHVDFDSFFAAVSLLKRPELKDKPVAISHGQDGASEIASCNYKARSFKVHNGMWMREAKMLCPELVVLPYDFEAYEEASKKFYNVLIGVKADRIQSVSIDEALLDVSSLCISPDTREPASDSTIEREFEKADSIATAIRDRIRELTGCEVSVGIGGNILIARIALRRAKPSGQYHIRPIEVAGALENLKVVDLPTVGRALTTKLLSDLNVETVGDLRSKSKETLVRVLGPKTGEKMYEYSRGINREVVGELSVRQSVSVNINWGIRFENMDQVETFLRQLSEELSRRLEKQKKVGKALTLTIMTRAADAPVITPKFLGCGKCDTISKSVSLDSATFNAGKIYDKTIFMFRQNRIRPTELRGFALQMTALSEYTKGFKEVPSAQQQTLSFAKKTSSSSGAGSNRTEPPKVTKATSSSQEAQQKKLQPNIPPVDLSQVDPTFLEELNNMPSELRDEILADLAQQQQQQRQQGPISQPPPFAKSPSSTPSKRKTAQHLKSNPGMSRPISSPPLRRPPSQPFKTESNLTSPTDNEHEECPEGYDPEVFYSLPEDLKKEILEDARRQGKLKKKASTSTLSNNNASRASNKPGSSSKPAAPIASIFQKRAPHSAPAKIPTVSNTHPAYAPASISHPRVAFQNLVNMGEIELRIKQWFMDALVVGPHEDDLKAWIEYLKQVVIVEGDSEKALGFVAWFIELTSTVNAPPEAHEDWYKGALEAREEVARIVEEYDGAR